MPKKLFVKGQSGNPRGKPKGARHMTTQITYAMLEGDLQEVLSKVLDKAKSGDMTACRMILDKVLPNAKDRAINLNLVDINNLSDIASAQHKIIDAVFSGDITPNEGEKISSIIESRRRVIETVDLETRITLLEGHK